jgi:hypothetical protein
MFEDYTFGNLLKESGINAICMRMFSDKLDQFKTMGFIAFHDDNHTHDLLSLHKAINN